MSHRNYIGVRTTTAINKKLRTPQKRIPKSFPPGAKIARSCADCSSLLPEWADNKEGSDGKRQNGKNRDNRNEGLNFAQILLKNNSKSVLHNIRVVF